MRSQSVNSGNVKTFSKAFLLKWALRQKTGNQVRKSILLTIAANADGNGHCHLSARSIAAAAECSRISALRALKELHKDGFIKRTERVRGDNSRAPDLITLVISQRTPPVIREITPPCDQRDHPLGEVSISTQVSTVVLDDRYHLDNQPQYLEPEGSEGVVDRWWHQPFADRVDVTCGGLL